ncbi:hypothetical protein [Micromonospora aurantiaca (nom. illeg.)]|uniref:hypothetical protein n=1 Tax=Micromonospora aurantiaca (nom. illeg.) TaxID=47850 RepID=UPI00160A03B9
MKIVCTGKGTHRLIQIGRVREDGAIVQRDVRDRQIRNPSPGATNDVYDVVGSLRGMWTERQRHGRRGLRFYVTYTRGGYELNCPKCGRCEQIRYDRWEAALLQMAGNKLEALDISRLPF